MELLLNGDVLADVGFVFLELPLVFLILQMRVQRTEIVLHGVVHGPAEDVVGRPTHRLID